MRSLNTTMATSNTADRAAWRERINLWNQEFSAVQGWSAQQVNARSNLSRTTEQLIKHNFTLSDLKKNYYEAGKGLRGMVQNMRASADAIAREQVRLQQSQFVGLEQHGLSGQRGQLFTPDSIIGNQTAKIAAARLAVYKEMAASVAEEQIKLGKNMQWSGRQLTYGFTMPVIAATAAMAALTLHFNEAQTRFARVYGDLSTGAPELKRELELVTEQSKELAKTWGANITETMQMAASFAAAGYQSGQLRNAVQETTRISILGEVDRQQAMEASISLINAMGIANKDLGDTFNYINALENQTVLTTQDFIAAIPRAGGVVHEFGGTVKDLGIFLTAMKAGGIEATVGANALRSSIAALVNPSNMTREILQGMNIDLERLVADHPQDLIGIFRGLGAELDRLSEPERQKALSTIFGRYRFGQIGIMIRGLLSDTNEVGNQVSQAMRVAGMSTEELGQIATREMNRFQASTAQKFHRAVETIKADLAGAGEQAIKLGTIFLNTFSGLVRFIEHIPGPIKNIGKLLIAAFAIGGPILMAVGLLRQLAGWILKIGTGAIFLGKKVQGIDTQFQLLTEAQITQLAATREATNAFNQQSSSIEVLNAHIDSLITKYATLNPAMRAAALKSGLTTTTGAAVISAEDKRSILAKTQTKGYYVNDKGQRRYGFIKNTDVSAAKQLAQNEADIARNAGKAADATTKAGVGTRVWASAGMRVLTVITGIGLGMQLLGGTSNNWLQTLGAITIGLSLMGPIISRLGVLLRKTFAAKIITDFVSKSLAAGGVRGLIGKLVGGLTGAGKAAEEGAKKTGLLSRAFRGLTAFGPRIAPFAPAIIGVGAAVTAVAGGVMLWKNHLEKVRQEQRNIVNSAENMAQLVGASYEHADAWVKTVGVEAGETAKAMEGVLDTWVEYTQGDFSMDERIDWLKKNKEALTALGPAIAEYQKGDKELTTFLSKQAKEMILGGIDPKQVRAAIENTLKFITGSTQLIYDVDFDITKNKKKLTNEVGVIYATELGEKFTNNFGEALTTGGQAYIEELGKKMAGFDMSPADAKKFVNNVAEPFKLAISNLKNYKLSDQDLAALGPNPERMLAEIMSNDNSAYQNIGLSPQLTALIQNAKMAKTAMDDLAVSFAKQRGITGVDGKEIKSFSGLMYALGYYAKDTKDDLDNVADSTDKVGSAARKTRGDFEGMVNAFRQAIEANMGELTSTLMEQFDDNTQAHEDALDKQQEAEENNIDRRIRANDVFWKVLGNYAKKGYGIPLKAAQQFYNEEIKGLSNASVARKRALRFVQQYADKSGDIRDLEKRLKAEQNLDDTRQRMYEAQIQRIQRMQEIESMGYDVNIALDTGQFDQAAQIMGEMAAKQEGWLYKDAQDSADRASEKRQRELEKRINQLKKERDALSRHFEKEGQMYDRILEKRKDQIDEEFEHRKEAYERQRDLEKRMLEESFDRLTATVPKTQKEYDKLIAALQKSFGRFGDTINTQSAAWNHLTATSWHRGVMTAAREVANDTSWARWGKKIASSATEGALGMSWRQFLRFLETGKMPKTEKATDVPLGVSVDNQKKLGIYQGHSGGRAEYLGKHIKGRLENDETPAILQRGEWVIQKSAVNRYGHDTLEAINEGRLQIPKFHKGGGVNQFVLGLGARMFQQLGAAIHRGTEIGLEKLMTRRAKKGLAVPPMMSGTMGSGMLGMILEGLRMVESGGNYRARSSISDASGAYQYLKSTWNNFGGFPEAYLAPPGIQDRRARGDLRRAYRSYGDWEKVIAAHLYPAWANNKGLWDKSPAPGNPTVREYVNRVLKAAGISEMGNMPVGGKGQTFKTLEMMANMGPGHIVTSTTGGRHAAGSYHYLGQAIDLGAPGGPADARGMLRIDRFFASKYGRGLRELIYGGPGGVNIKDGRFVNGWDYYGPSTMRQHLNHVHVAADPSSLSKIGMAKGGMVLQNDVLRNLHKNEAVLTAPLSKKLESGIDKLDRGGNITYDIDVIVPDTNASPDAIATAVLKRIELRDMRVNQQRRIGR